MSASRDIAVLGAGLMGHGIALTFARAGHEVRVYDAFRESLDTLHERVRASLAALGAGEVETAQTLGRITPVPGLADSVRNTDFIFEAAPEKPELKRALFADAERHAPADCIFASNTSVIPITTIMADLGEPGRALGTHWWNPRHMIPLVEVIRTEWTSETVIDATMELLASVDKTPVRVEKDVAGFIGNPPMNFLPAKAAGDGKWEVAGNTFDGPSGGEPLKFAIRPEDMQPSDHGIKAVAKVVEPLGAHLLVTCEVDGQLFRAVLESDLTVKAGDTLMLAPQPDRVRWFNAETTHAVA